MGRNICHGLHNVREETPVTCRHTARAEDPFSMALHPQAEGAPVTCRHTPRAEDHPSVPLHSSRGKPGDEPSHTSSRGQTNKFAYMFAVMGCQMLHEIIKKLPVIAQSRVVALKKNAAETGHHCHRGRRQRGVHQAGRGVHRDSPARLPKATHARQQDVVRAPIALCVDRQVLRSNDVFRLENSQQPNGANEERTRTRHRV